MNRELLSNSGIRAPPTITLAVKFQSWQPVCLPDCWPINVPALCSGLNILDILYALRIIIILLPTYLFLISLHPSVSLPTYVHSLYVL